MLELIFIIILFFTILVIFLPLIRMRHIQKQLEEKTRQYESEMAEKSNEVSEIVEELRTTQLKLTF